MNDYAKAIDALNELTDQRLDADYPFLTDDYADYQTEINSDPRKLLKAIYYNWRMEMWGEGYGLQTFRRLGLEFDKRKRGGSHDYNPGGEVYPTDVSFNMDIPTSESVYNPNI